MEARLTLRSKTATKAEKEAAEADLARALGEADPDETPGSPTDPAPRTTGPAKTADRVAGSTPVQQRGAGRGR